MCELDNLGNTVAVSTFGPAGLASRHTSASGTTFYAWDGRGNPSQTVNSSGTVTNTFSFDGYGKYTSTIAPTDPYSNYGGQWGYYTDPETGLTLCGHRFYDAYTARFLNRDPIGQNGGANVYQYVGGSPLMGADPSGFMSEFCMPGVNDVFDPLSGGGELGSEAESMGMGGDIPCPEGVLEEAGGGGEEPPVGIGESGSGDEPIVLAGHGSYNPANGTVTLGPGQSISFWADHGNEIDNELGLAIEDGIARSPLEIYGPGDTTYNYTLGPPDADWQVRPTSVSVAENTLFSEMIGETPGEYQWAACRDVEGLLAEWVYSERYPPRYGK